MHVFFFEIPSFEELQDPDSSPRREEVGRRTLRDYGGFLLSFFFIGIDFSRIDFPPLLRKGRKRILEKRLFLVAW